MLAEHVSGLQQGVTELQYWPCALQVVPVFDPEQGTLWPV
jgi:hypothetical protein